MFCGNCGSQIDDGTMFCPFCGNRQAGDNGQLSAENDVAKNSVSDKGETVFLDSNKRIKTDSVQFQPGNLPIRQKPQMMTTRAKKENNVLKIILIVAAAIVAIVCVGIFAFKSLTNKTSDRLVYLKENKLYLTDATNSSTKDIGDIQEDGYQWQYEHIIYISDDGKYILFGYEQNDSDTVDLYYSKEAGKASLICEDVDDYYLSQGMAVYRVRDEMFVFDFKDKEEENIADNIVDCIAGEASEKIAYIDSDDVLYITEDDEKTEIDSKVTDILGCSSDMKHVVYTKDDGLYVCTEGEKAELISDNYKKDSVVISEGEKLNICFKSPGLCSAYMFVEDDLDDSEAKDVRQKLQFTEVFKDGEFTSLNIYKKELDKESDGTLTSVTGGPGLADSLEYDISGDDMVCIMSFVKNEDIPKILLSEFVDDYGTDFDGEDIENIILESVEDSFEWQISRKGVATDCKKIKGSIVNIATDSKKSDFCYVCVDKGDDKYEIGKINLRGKETGEYSTLYSGGRDLWYADNGCVVYIDKSGNLCVNDTKIEKNIDSVEYME